MATRHYIVASLCIAASLLLAYADDGEHAAAEVEAAADRTPVVDCESRIQVIPSPDDRLDPRIRRKSIFVGPVVFFGAKMYRDDPRRDFRPRRPGRRVVVKIPVAVEAERIVTLRLLGRSRRRALIEIGLDQRPFRVRARRVELRACPADATVAGRPVGRRTPFNGGFKLERPQCLKLAIDVEGTVEPLKRRIAFGRGTCRRSRTTH